MSKEEEGRTSGTELEPDHTAERDAALDKLMRIARRIAVREEHPVRDVDEQAGLS
ncbi:MAG TPA: hypothetical protein VNC78_06105 [Actinomycetota bacterium]|nr:hypothetical protein [Actinomycetota bacterium]